MGVNCSVRRKAIESSIETNGITKKIEESEGIWRFITKTGKKSSEMEFRIGVPFYQILAGNSFKTTVTLDRNLMKSDCKAMLRGKKSFQVIRKFSGNGFESKIICEDIVCKEYFIRQ